MFKTISAAALAVSVLAAPAFAAGPARTAHAPAVKSVVLTPSVRNANAKMIHRHHHYRKPIRHHRMHKHH
ncbi:MAG TPA: hypothetical protein VHC94_01940 [Nitrobacter sp.]|jgi:hypothetical protein|nr:hypothetical protein [Nitrobacter sp.]